MIKLKCPKCGSESINQYRMITGKIWCDNCNFTALKKEIDNPFKYVETIPIPEEYSKK